MVQLGQCSVKFWSALLWKDSKARKIGGSKLYNDNTAEKQINCLGVFWMGKRQLHEDITGICKFRSNVEKECVLIEVVVWR